jgi:hypothetical protein
VIDPSWECYLDGTLLSAVPFFPEQNNNWLFCSQDTASDGPHIITVNATVLRNEPFWFDEIRYVPSATVPLDQESIFVDHADPQLQYGGGWQDGMTNTTGSIFTFDFIGMRSHISMIVVSHDFQAFQ